jgi:hypothetical protein
MSVRTLETDYLEPNKPIIKMRYALLLAFTSLSLAFACNKKVVASDAETVVSTTVTKNIIVGGQESLAIGESCGVDKMKAIFTFVELVNDNRCPKGVNCIQAGEATLLVSVNGKQPQKVVLDADPKRTASVTVEGGSFVMSNLTPYPESGIRIDPAQRRLRVRFVAGEKMK